LLVLFAPQTMPRARQPLARRLAASERTTT
jgi:hypothetical protein